MTTAKCRGIAFSDKDVVNLDDWIPVGEPNPHNVRPFLLHDHGFPVAVVFADCLQDAIDVAADAGKLDRYHVTPEEMEDYGATEEEQLSRLSFAGIASEPYDLEALDYEELPNCRLSFCACFSQR